MAVPVAVALAVRLVVLLVVGDRVVEREAVMRSDEVHRSPRLAPALVELVRRGRDARGEPRQQSGIALPVAAHVVAEPVVPLGPARREAADLITAGAAIPRLGDELDVVKHRVLAAGVEEAAALVEAVGLAAEDGGEIEAEAVDPHLGRPVAQAVGDELQHAGIGEVEGVPVPVSLM